MTDLVECVPNFSEGRRPEVVDAIAARVRQVAGRPPARPDARSRPQPERADLRRACQRPFRRRWRTRSRPHVELIDMERHEGQHPRIGAVDVIPFVPLGDTTLDECVALARDFGDADRAALRAARVPVREGGRCGRIARSWPTSAGRSTRASRSRSVQPERTPDFGPARMHPTAGAVAVGARPFLIAYNINLESRDIELAQSHRAPGPRTIGRIAARPGARPVPRRPSVRAGVDEPARSFGHPDLARLGDGRRGGACAGRRAARIGADRARPDRGAARSRGPHRHGRRTCPTRSESRPRRRGSTSATSSRRWRSSCASPRPSAAHDRAERP